MPKNANQSRFETWETRGVANPLGSDELGAVGASLLLPEPPKPTGGRPRVPDRAALTGIVFVPKSGLPWEGLPPEMGRGSGVRRRRRVRDWQADGVWEQLHRALLDRLGEGGQIARNRASLDRAAIPAKRGAGAPAPTPPTAAPPAPNGPPSPSGAVCRWRSC